MNSQKTQKIFNVGDLVRWKVNLVTLRPAADPAQVEALGIIRKISGVNLELKVLNTKEVGRDYLNALKDLSAWEKLPAHIDDCEVIA